TPRAHLEPPSLLPPHAWNLIRATCTTSTSALPRPPSSSLAAARRRKRSPPTLGAARAPLPRGALGSGGSRLFSTRLQPISPRRSGEFSTQLGSNCADAIRAEQMSTIVTLRVAALIGNSRREGWARG